MKSPLSLFLAEIYPTKLKNNQSTTICRIQNDILMILKDKDEKVNLFNIHPSITFNFEEERGVTANRYINGYSLAWLCKGLLTAIKSFILCHLTDERCQTHLNTTSKVVHQITWSLCAYIWCDNLN